MIDNHKYRQPLQPSKISESVSKGEVEYGGRQSCPGRLGLSLCATDPYLCSLWIIPCQVCSSQSPLQWYLLWIIPCQSLPSEALAPPWYTVGSPLQYPTIISHSGCRAEFNLLERWSLESDELEYDQATSQQYLVSDMILYHFDQFIGNLDIFENLCF